MQLVGLLILFILIYVISGLLNAIIWTLPLYVVSVFVFSLIQAANENNASDDEDYDDEDYEAYDIEGERYFYYVDRTGLVTLRHVMVLDDDDDRIETVDFTAGRRQRTFIKNRILKELSEKEFNKLSKQDIERTIAELQEKFIVKEKSRSYQKNTGNQVEVCFTGFGKVEKAELISLAKENDMLIRDSVTTRLDILVTGDNAGPSKTKSAKGKGIKITDAGGFRKFLETGEI
tara:strand:- start:290 stop:985 length:696 start_codon:yes stop_codon:yes gene_type:complete